MKLITSVATILTLLPAIFVASESRMIAVSRNARNIRGLRSSSNECARELKSTKAPDSTKAPNKNVKRALKSSKAPKSTKSPEKSQEVRFEKFNFTSPQLGLQMASKIKFPIDDSSVKLLRENSKSNTVVLDKDVCETVGVDIEKCLTVLKDKGLFPPSNPENQAFWSEFAEVVNVQAHLKRKQENPCMTDPLPLVMSSMTHLWQGFGILDVAEAVHGEFPGTYHNQMLANWVGDKDSPLRYNADVIPKVGNVDFLRNVVMLADMVGYAFRVVGPCNFSLKWRVGRARPEEVAWKLNQGGIIPPKGIDVSEIKLSISEMNLESATDFTAYPEGSPTHPS